MDVYVTDKHSLFKRFSVKRTQNFEDFVDYTIRGFINAYLKKESSRIFYHEGAKNICEIQRTV